MAPHMQNAGVEPGVSRNQLGGWLHPSLTASGRQAQMLAARVRLSPWMARDMAWLCFGEGQGDD